MAQKRTLFQKNLAHPLTLCHSLRPSRPKRERSIPISYRHMSYAVIKTGGKQHRVIVGEYLDVMKLAANEGDAVNFDQVLAAGEGDSVKNGAPFIAGASVAAKVLKQHRAAKVTAFKFKRRKGYHRTKGHKQEITRVQITSINA